MTLFKVITTAIIMTVIKTTIMIMISTTVFQNITEKLEKWYILFSQFWECYWHPRYYMPPTGKKRCYKITADHK